MRRSFYSENVIAGGSAMKSQDGKEQWATMFICRGQNWAPAAAVWRSFLKRWLLQGKTRVAPASWCAWRPLLLPHTFPSSESLRHDDDYKAIAVTQLCHDARDGATPAL